MAKILLLETSTEVCAAAISVDGEVIACFENLEASSHSALLTLQIEDCTRMAGITLAQLDAVALSAGPGSYTALRVGASVAKGICYALNKPLIAVDTLLALAGASRVVSPGTVVYVPMIDARRQEVWLAAYDADFNEILPAQPLVLENNSFENSFLPKLGNAAAGRYILSGNGMKKMRSGEFSEKAVFSEIKKCDASYLAPWAERLFQLADFQDIAYFEPTYMKPPNITTPARPLF